MLRPLHVFLIPALVFSATPTRAQTPVDPILAAVLQQKLDSCRNVHDVPGISATLLLPGDQYWNGVTGVADIYTLEPLDTFHVFQAASVTKLFTATIVFQLIEEGLLDLDDTLGTFLPPIPNIPGNTRIRYLLNQRSGIYNYTNSPGLFDEWYNYPDSIWPPEQTLIVFGAPPIFPQNTAWSYSNSNYHLLGMIVEQVTGNTFAQELHDRILTPLGLQDVYFPPVDPITGALTPGWSSFTFPGVYDTDVTPVLADCFASIAYSAGALVTAPHDLARTCRAVMTGALLDPATLTTMRTCTNVSFSDGANGYGYGTMRYTYAGRDYFGHSGDISGFTQMVMHSEEDSVTLALSMNRNSASRGPIAGALLSTLHAALGMTDVADAPAFELYPVPATGRVTIASEALLHADRVELLDAAGRQLRSVRAMCQPVMEIGLSGLAPGIYLVQVVSAQVRASRRLVVE